MTSEEKDNERRFQVGEVYIATPAIQGQPRKLAAIIGREGSMLQVAFVDELVVGESKMYDGRDFASLETRIGRYNISACVKAAAKDAAIVNDILKSQKKLKDREAIGND